MALDVITKMTQAQIDKMLREKELIELQRTLDSFGMGRFGYVTKIREMEEKQTEDEEE